MSYIALCFALKPCLQATHREISENIAAEFCEMANELDDRARREAGWEVANSRLY